MEALWYVVVLVASILITSALTPKQQPPDPAGIDDFKFPQFEEGTPQVVFFGDCWSPDWMVLAVGNYRTTAIDAPPGGKK